MFKTLKIKKEVNKLSFETIQDRLIGIDTSRTKGFDVYTKYLIKRYNKLVKKAYKKINKIV